MRIARVATLGFVVYVLAALAIGELYPISRFSMYSWPPHEATAAPWFRADGELADAGNYACFVGVDPERLRPPELPLSTRAIWHDWRRWAATRRSDGARASVPVEFGYVVLSYRGGRLSVSDPVIQTAGMACLR